MFSAKKKAGAVFVRLAAADDAPDNMHTLIQRWIYVSLFVGITYSFFAGPIPFCTTAPRWLD